MVCNSPEVLNFNQLVLRLTVGSPSWSSDGHGVAGGSDRQEAQLSWLAIPEVNVLARGTLIELTAGDVHVIKCSERPTSGFIEEVKLMV